MRLRAPWGPLVPVTQFAETLDPDLPLLDVTVLRLPLVFHLQTRRRLRAERAVEQQVCIELHLAELHLQHQSELQVDAPIFTKLFGAALGVQRAVFLDIRMDCQVEWILATGKQIVVMPVQVGLLGARFRRVQVTHGYFAEPLARQAVAEADIRASDPRIVWDLD